MSLKTTITLQEFLQLPSWKQELYAQSHFTLKPEVIRRIAEEELSSKTTESERILRNVDSSGIISAGDYEKLLPDAQKLFVVHETRFVNQYSGDGVLTYILKTVARENEIAREVARSAESERILRNVDFPGIISAGDYEKLLPDAQKLFVVYKTVCHHQLAGPEVVSYLRKDIRANIINSIFTKQFITPDEFKQLCDFEPAYSHWYIASKTIPCGPYGDTKVTEYRKIR